MRLKEGQKAPDFSLKDQDGNLKNLDNFKGRNLVLYFYPKDFTSGCTTEACTIQENYTELSKLAKVVGISRIRLKAIGSLLTNMGLSLPF